MSKKQYRTKAPKAAAPLALSFEDTLASKIERVCGYLKHPTWRSGGFLMSSVDSVCT